MVYWSDSGTSTSTSYEPWGHDDYEHVDKKPTKLVDKKPTKLKYSSEPLGKIVSAGIIGGNVSMFAYRGSPIFRDTGTLSRTGIIPYCNDPVTPGYDAPTKLFSYNFSIIIDALEYIQGKMAKANLIKEALATLKPSLGLSVPFVMILTKTRKMVEELAKSSGYEEVKDGFLITDGPFIGLVIQGLDVEDLMSIAHFVGAKYVVEDASVKTDLTCVKVYLNKQV